MKTLRVVLALVAAVSLSPAKTRQLFNGKDLTGWKHVGPGGFTVADGLLKPEGGMGLLWYTGERFGNCKIKIVYKTTTERDNSGLYIRMAEPPPDPWYGVHNGYEVQIDGAGDDWHSSGALYSLSKVTEHRQKPAGEWNVMEVEIRGQTTRVSLNGKVVNTFVGSQPVPERKQWYEPVRGPRPDAGYIGLQNHDGRSVMYFKEISVTK